MWSEHYTPPGVPTQGPWELKAKFGPQWRQVLVVGAVTEQCYVTGTVTDQPAQHCYATTGHQKLGEK